VPPAADEGILHERAFPYHPEDRLKRSTLWDCWEDSHHQPLPLRWGGVTLRVVRALSARGGCMGDRRRRLAREDLEAMRQEFVVGERAGSLDDDLHQIRRSARLGVSPEDWARARKLAPAYGRALRRYLDQG
jgi:hypothetical protein